MDIAAATKTAGAARSGAPFEALDIYSLLQSIGLDFCDKFPTSVLR
jgi:hypothetical protein